MTATPQLSPAYTFATASSPAASPAPAELQMRLTYAITPPNRTTSLERRLALAAAQSERVASLPIDALLVYDVQDEATRNGNPRPFSFVPKVDPLSYAFDELQVGGLPRVVYRAVSGQGEASLRAWLGTLHAHGGHAVLVGAPSRDASASLTLPRALSVCRKHTPQVRVGGVLIAERHTTSGDEDARAWAKLQQGCSFFVSQTVWSVSATKRLLHALRLRAEREGEDVPPILFTSSPCGSAQTLQFLQWLGVDVPPSIQRELLSARDMLARSIELATEVFAELSAFASAQGLKLGCNVESVSTRASEIDASVELVRSIARLERDPKTSQHLSA
jgi:hypothetical protein